MDIAFQVIYVYIFFIFREIFRATNKKSSLRLLFEAFMKQTDTYLRSNVH